MVAQPKLLHTMKTDNDFERVKELSKTATKSYEDFDNCMKEIAEILSTRKITVKGFFFGEMKEQIFNNVTDVCYYDDVSLHGYVEGVGGLRFQPKKIISIDE